MASRNEIYKELTTAKLILMFGVVLIHCNFIPNLPESILSRDLAGIKFIELVSQYLCGCCVPAFFMISGFLFFRNIPHQININDLLSTYKKKVASRFRSLVLPYIIWNIIGAFCFLFKCYYFNFDSQGVLNDGHIHWIEFLKGFFSLQNGYPYDFPFWFIRNLICYIILTPIFYYLSRNKWIFIISFCGIILFYLSFHTKNFFMVSFFLIGCYAGLHKNMYSLMKLRYTGIIGLFIWIAFSLIQLLLPEISPLVKFFLYFISNIAGGCAIIWMSDKIIVNRIKLSAQAVFFIYAVHGLYCSVIRKGLLNIIGDDTSLKILLVYINSFAVLVASSLLVYYFTKAVSPKLAAVMSGGRTT